MATLKMESPDNGGVRRAASDAAATLDRVQNEVFPHLGSVKSVRVEIDDALADMRLFHQNEPDVVITAVSAHSARMAEIVTQTRRLEVQYRQWKPVREEAEFVLDRLRDQYQYHSRLLSVRQLDFQLSGGQA